MLFWFWLIGAVGNNHSRRAMVLKINEIIGKSVKEVNELQLCHPMTN
jgi:hypothetical protein